MVNRTCGCLLTNRPIGFFDVLHSVQSSHFWLLWLRQLEHQLQLSQEVTVLSKNATDVWIFVTALEGNLICRRCWGSTMTYVYTTSFAAPQRSVRAVTTKCYSKILAAWHSSYTTAATRSAVTGLEKPFYVFGVCGPLWTTVVRQSIKVLAPTCQPRWLRRNQIFLFGKITFCLENLVSGEMAEIWCWAEI